MKSAAFRFRLLGDEVRLRLLWLLRRERLNVGELTSILGLAQSGVSRHLRLLKEGDLVAETRDAGYAYFRAREIPELGFLADDPGHPEDRARLQEVLRHRHEEFRDRKAEAMPLVPGRSWTAWARALGHLLPPLRAADLASGEGYLSIEIARWAGRVYAVDRSSAALRRARERARRVGVKNIHFKRGEIEKLPLPDRSVDLVVFSQALRHAQDPLRALREAARVLAHQGKVLLLDLRKHQEAWVRERLGDRWLGFDERTLQAQLRRAGFSHIRTQKGVQRRGDPFKVFIMSGTRS